MEDSLPSGWECKLDIRSGKNYYINHATRTTTWEDPRTRTKSLVSSKQPSESTGLTGFPESLTMQHGSPDLRRNYVYPSQPSPIPAFQMPSQHSPKYLPFQDLKSIAKGSPLSVRSSRVQDSSFTTLTDGEEAVTKISAMFPTVPETHIRILMKKYHNRAALVISALQVEKYPVTTPGPFATPPPQRNIHQPTKHVPLHMTPPLGLRSSRGGSPVLKPGSGTNSTYMGSPRIGDNYRSSPRPHSSPKLKLRYMKSVFPDAEETVILEILCNNESNIQKTTDILREMGFQKKDTVKVAQQKMEDRIETVRAEEEKRHKPPTPPPKIKTLEEKSQIKERLKEKYRDVAEPLITMALESVNFSEERANQLLQIMEQANSEAEASSSRANESPEDEIDAVEVSPQTLSVLPVSQSRQSIKSLLKSEKVDKDKNVYSRVIGSNGYKSPYLSNTQGANPELAKGNNDDLLLEDYVKWQGPNLSSRKGPQAGLAKGPNSALRIVRSYQPCGPNSELRKGPQVGLAKGSIFAQLKTIVVGESRGK